MPRGGHGRSRRASNGCCTAPCRKWHSRNWEFYAFGVTTIRSINHYYPRANELLLRLRVRAAAGELVSPRIYTAGALWGKSYCPDKRLQPGEIADIVRTLQAAGYDFTTVTAHYQAVLRVRRGIRFRRRSRSPAGAPADGPRTTSGDAGASPRRGHAVHRASDGLLPVQDIRHSQELAGVMVAGWWFDRAAIDQHSRTP
jgi:hypothetical protein